MGSENEIERFYTVEHEEHDEGEWVRWPDHVAALQQLVQEAADLVYARETAARKKVAERIAEAERKAYAAGKKAGREEAAKEIRQLIDAIESQDTKAQAKAVVAAMKERAAEA